MKRHFFSLFMLCVAIFGWIVLTSDAPSIQTFAESSEVITADKTAIIGTAVVDASRAKEWAASRGGTEKFVNVADIYWKMGKEFGIRADVLYAQAAKETAFGNFTGNVSEDMNNWAGIKKADSAGDARDDHESFATAEDGVRAHFNHMAAYVGIKPIGTPHPRYSSVMSATWAGTVVYAEDLGGKWAPAMDYGESLVKDYLTDLCAITI